MVYLARPPIIEEINALITMLTILLYVGAVVAILLIVVLILEWWGDKFK